jgi:predicted RNA-binding protein with PUA-like domain
MQVWLFQAVPKNYDLTKEVPHKKIEDWPIRAYRREMQVGDVVLLWQAGRKAGIYALGELSSEPYERPFAGKGEKTSARTTEWCVDVKYVRLLRHPILKPELVEHPVLGQLSVLRQPFFGTSFRVEQEQWIALQDLISQDAPSDLETIIQDTGREEAENGVFDPKDIQDARKRILVAIVRRRGQPAFRQKLLGIYSGRCSVTGCDVEQALEAAHISPYKGEKTNHPSNGLLMRADLHTLFDLHLVSVDTATMTLLLASALKHTSYGELEGRRLSLPKSNAHKPSKAALDQHRVEFEKRQTSQ